MIFNEIQNLEPFFKGFKCTILYRAKVKVKTLKFFFKYYPPVWKVGLELLLTLEEQIYFFYLK